MNLQQQDQEVDAVYDEFWKEIIEPNGVVNFEQVKRELFDYHTLLENVPKVYDHITRGRISKPNTLASAVIAIADDLAMADVNEAIREALELEKANAEAAPLNPADLVETVWVGNEA